MNEQEIAKLITTPAAQALVIVWLHFRMKNIENRMDTLFTHFNLPIPPKKKMRSALLLTLAAALMLNTGCSFVRGYDKQRQAGFSALMPAWPWQDSNRALERLSINSKTNATSISVRGLNDSETTSTNSVNLISDVAGAVVGAAIKAAK